MDILLDWEIYDGLKLPFETSRLPQIKVLHARTLKFSLNQPDQEYMEIGEAIFNAGQFQKSIFPFKKAIIIHPKNARAHLFFGKDFLESSKGE